MTEPEFKNAVEEIKTYLRTISTNTKPSVRRSFVDGMMRGIGSIFGVALAIALIGWILNTVGIIPAFRDQVNEWQQTLENLRGSR